MTRLSPAVQAGTGGADVGVVVRKLVAAERPALGTVSREMTVRTTFSTVNPSVQLKKGWKVTHVSQWCSLLVILGLFLLFIDGRSSLFGS